MTCGFYTGRAMCGGGAETIMEHMNTASFTPSAQGAHAGATALDHDHARHGLGNALRVLKVFAGAAVSVVLLGEYNDKQAVRTV